MLSAQGSASAQTFSDYRIRSATVDTPSTGLRRTRLGVSVGSDPLDKLEIVRVQRAGVRGLLDAPVIMLSPFGFRTAFWEMSTDAYNDSFVARVASAGYDVWLVDNRTAQLEPGSCETGAVDCSAMSDWGIDTGVDDAMYARALVVLAHPLQKPVIGGFSGGSSAAIASVNAYPDAFAGLLMWEGTTYTADPAIRARNATFCAADEAALAAGQVVDPSVQGFKAIFGLAAAAPNGVSPIPLFPSGTTNLQALVLALSSPDPTNPLNFTPNFVRLVATPFSTSFTYSDLDRVMLLGPQIGNYAPIKFLRDSHCGMSGSENFYNNHLSAFRGDVLVYAAGLGFGQMMVDTANLMTHADVTVQFHEALGESDIYYHHAWVEVAVEPFLTWLSAVDFRRIR